MVKAVDCKILLTLVKVYIPSLTFVIVVNSFQGPLKVKRLRPLWNLVEGIVSTELPR